MKQLAIALILVLLTCPLLPAAAEDGLTAVDCAEEGFSTMIPAGCTAKYTEGTGLQIFVENAGYIPYVIVSRRPADMQFSNPTGYLNNVYREYMENRYGDNMIGMNPAKDWQVGGKTLLGARYLYKVGETTVCLLHLIEIREESAARAVSFLARNEKYIAEPSSCLTVAAVMDYPERVGGKNIALVISGGNIDGDLLTELLVKYKG